VLDARGLTPQKVGRHERERKPYDRATALGMLAERPTPYEQSYVYLWRTAALKYEASLSKWDAAYLELSFKLTPPASEWARVFELADALAEFFHPDWGAAGIAFDLRAALTNKLVTDDERDAYFIHSATCLLPIDYVRHGPQGLGARRYIGPFFAEQFGMSATGGVARTSADEATAERRARAASVTAEQAPEVEVRKVGGESSLTRDRERNVQWDPANVPKDTKWGTAAPADVTHLMDSAERVPRWHCYSSRATDQAAAVITVSRHGHVTQRIEPDARDPCTPDAARDLEMDIDVVGQASHFIDK